MNDLVKNGNEDYDEDDLGDIFLGDYYADTVVFDGRIVSYLITNPSTILPTPTMQKEL